MTEPLHIGADLETMLRFYHDLGKIVYFGSLSQEKRALNDMVILEPQMLVDVFKEIITIAKPKPSVSAFPLVYMLISSCPMSFFIFKLYNTVLLLDSLHSFDFRMLSCK